MLVPKLRFKREDGTDYPEWEKDKWSALGDFVASGTLSKADLAETGTPCILYGELYTKYGEIAHMIYSKTSATSHTFSQADDVVLPKSGETPEDISTATCIPYGGISLGGDLIVFRHNEKVIGAYLSYLISNRAKNAIASIAQGKSVVHINEKALSNIELPYPQIEEQQKIADFFSAVDEVIAQSEAEVQNLEQQKKAAMQKIFSQEVRFKREDGTDYPEWRYARTDEIAEINPKTSDLPNRFYYMDLGSVSKGAWQEKTITDKDNAPSRANRLASVGDVFFQSVRPYNMGHFFFEEEYEYPVVASTGFIQLRATQEYYNGFIYQLLYEDRFNAEVSIRCTGSNYPAINSENFSDIEMLFPCLEEQQKIADFLSAYDEAISYAKQELDKWKELKKGLLQQMFV